MNRTAVKALRTRLALLDAESAEVTRENRPGTAQMLRCIAEAREDALRQLHELAPIA